MDGSSLVWLLNMSPNSSDLSSTAVRYRVDASAIRIRKNVKLHRRASIVVAHARNVTRSTPCIKEICRQHRRQMVHGITDHILDTMV